MLENALSSDLLYKLARRYEEDPDEFVHLPQPTVASSLARQTLAELRNEGYVEEEVRGVIRLTERGYKAGRWRERSLTWGLRFVAQLDAKGDRRRAEWPLCGGESITVVHVWGPGAYQPVGSLGLG